MAYGPEEPGHKPVRDFHLVPEIVNVQAYLPGDAGKLGGCLAPVLVGNDLLQRHFVVHGGEAGLVLAGAEEGHQEAPLVRLKAEDKVVLACLGLDRGRKIAQEGLAPVRGVHMVFRLMAFFLVQFVHKVQGQGGNMAADAGKGIGAVAFRLDRAVGYGKCQARRVELEVVSLDAAADGPCLPFLNVHFLHAGFGQDEAAGIAYVFGHLVVEKGLAQLQDDIVFGSAHDTSGFAGVWHSLKGCGLLPQIQYSEKAFYLTKPIF